MTRVIDKEVDDVCNLSEGIMEKGRVEMAIDMILGLMRTTNKSVSEVMDMADVDKAIRPQVEKAVKAMQQSTK